MKEKIFTLEICEPRRKQVQIVASNEDEAARIAIRLYESGELQFQKEDVEDYWLTVAKDGNGQMCLPKNIDFGKYFKNN